MLVPLHTLPCVLFLLLFLLLLLRLWRCASKSILSLSSLLRPLLLCSEQSIGDCV
jgi:hypothetical protein